MSRDPYYGGGRGRGERWDTERFSLERDRNRFTGETRERFEERDSRFLRSPGLGRARERSVDEIYERRGPREFEEDRYERRDYYDEPRMERERPFGRDRGPSITIEKERETEYYKSPSPPRRAPAARPAFLRRQSSLDTFDRKPLTRFVEREEYGPPARYRERDEYREELYRDDARPPPFTPIPLPRTKALPPPRRYAERDFREYEEIKVAEPDFYGDEDYRGFPERVREREIIRRRRRSRSKESKASRSVRSESISSSSSSDRETVRSEFPKRGKTRMPARLVSKRAIIDLGFPFEEEGDVIIIQKALGRENIDEVIKLSEDYKASESKPLFLSPHSTPTSPSNSPPDPTVMTTTLTSYLVGAEVEMSGGRSEAGTVIEEHRTEVFAAPAAPYLPPPPPGWIPPPPPGNLEVVTDTKIVEHHRSPSPARSHRSHHHGGPVIINAGPGLHEESAFVERRTETVERSDHIPIGPLALVPTERHRSKDERAIRAEIKALEAEKEALRAEKRADREMRKADRIRRGGRASEGELVLYDRETIERGGEEVTLVRRERVSEPEGGVRIEKDKKGRMAISVPKYYL